MKIGLFGGSFDPIHQGHIEPVREAQDFLQLDRVYFVPTACPPHKKDRALASRWARYAMVELALIDEPDFWASEVEIDPITPAYTVETLEYFRDREPEVQWTLLLGADSWVNLPRWHRWHDILLSTRIGVLMRPGQSLGELHPLLQRAMEAGRVRVVQNQPHEVSSSGIRHKIANREPLPDHWLPRRVLDYLDKYGLYR